MNIGLPTSPIPATIAIIGGGFSGALVATHLLRSATQPLTIKLIDSHDSIGRGIAYSTQSPCHLLNVPAGKMSAFADTPDHLLRWLQSHGEALRSLLPSGVNEATFIPRQVYGCYIQHVLQEAETKASASVRLERIVDEAVAVELGVDGAIVSLRSGRWFQADRIVLALGNPLAKPPAPLSYLCRGDRPVRDAWSASALTDLDPDASVLLIGTGLTMVDMAVALNQQGHRGQIYAVSRRGLFPQPHQPCQPYALSLPEPSERSHIRSLLRWLRAEVKTAIAQGYNWRSVLDALRPHTQALWQALPQTEQKRFLRHVKPYWEVHRHRIAQKVATVVDEMRCSGQLTVFAGRIRNYRELPDGLSVSIVRRGTGVEQSFTIQRVVNCTGAEGDYQRSTVPLIASLRSQNLIRPNALGLGLDTATSGALLDADGHPSKLLYTLGTPRKGDLWETTAVPEIRGQAQALANELLQSLSVQATGNNPIKAIAPDLEYAQPAEQTIPLFRQLFDRESSTYTYLIADPLTRGAILVDPVQEQVDRDLQLLRELGLTLLYSLETHIHADHITGGSQLRQHTGCRLIVPHRAKVWGADGWLGHGEQLQLGMVQLEAIATPGHTDSHMAYRVNQTYVLTGDALLIRGCGRTDFQGGDAGALYDAVTQRLFSLPDTTRVYPGHDYKGHTVSTIGDEKRWNQRFANRDRAQFVQLMNNLNLPYPKRMKQAVPANERCGEAIEQPVTVQQGTPKGMNNRSSFEPQAYWGMYI